MNTTVGKQKFEALAMEFSKNIINTGASIVSGTPGGATSGAENMICFSSDWKSVETMVTFVGMLMLMHLATVYIGRIPVEAMMQYVNVETTCGGNENEEFTQFDQSATGVSSCSENESNTTLDASDILPSVREDEEVGEDVPEAVGCMGVRAKERCEVAFQDWVRALKKSPSRREAYENLSDRRKKTKDQPIPNLTVDLRPYRVAGKSKSRTQCCMICNKTVPSGGSYYAGSTNRVCFLQCRAHACCADCFAYVSFRIRNEEKDPKPEDIIMCPGVICSKCS